MKKVIPDSQYLASTKVSETKESQIYIGIAYDPDGGCGKYRYFLKRLYNGKYTWFNLQTVYCGSIIDNPTFDSMDNAINEFITVYGGEVFEFTDWDDFTKSIAKKVLITVLAS